MSQTPNGAPATAAPTIPPSPNSVSSAVPCRPPSTVQPSLIPSSVEKVSMARPDSSTVDQPIRPSENGSAASGKTSSLASRGDHPVATRP